MNLYCDKLHNKQYEIALKCQKSEAKYRIINTGRGLGKTFLIPELMKMFGLQNNKTTFYISHTYTLANLMYNKLYAQFDKLKLVVSKKRGKYFELKNGARFEFYSFDKYDNLRGLNHANFIFLDEASKLSNHAWQDVVSFICRPSGVQHVYFISTPKGKNWFYQEYYASLDNANYLYLHATAYENPLIKQDTILIYDSLKGSKTYLQEIMAQFIEDGGEVFDDISRMFILDKYAISLKGRYYAGVDIAIINDYTVISILNEKKELCYFIRFNNQDHEKIMLAVIFVIKKFRCKVGIEQNNQGAKVIEMCQNYEGGNYKRYIFPFQTQGNKGGVTGSKNMLIQDLIVSIDRNEIKLLKKDSNKSMWIIEAEFSSYSKRTSSFNNIIYGKNGINDDTVMSIGLANHMCNKYEKKYTA